MRSCPQVEKLRLRGVRGLIAAIGALCLPAVAYSQVRNYNVQFTNTAPTIDGVISAGEWDSAAASAGDWRELRQPFTDVDTENNRFRMLWDDTNLYILYETNFNNWQPADKVGTPNPGISFGADNLNMYFDPNRDGDPIHTDPNAPLSDVDGYQLAFNQFSDPDGGSLVSTNANRQGVGFFTEAHVGTPFGDHAQWNRGGDPVAGAALQDIVVAQRNTASGGVAEVVFPWANFNADAFTPGATDVADFNSDGRVDGHDFLIWQRNRGQAAVDKSTGDANGDFLVDDADLTIWETNHGINTQVPTGLNRVEGPDTGEIWSFNMSRINGEGDIGNFLPIWNWHSEQSFAFHPHGTITFVGGAPAVGAVPEPAGMLLMLVAGASAAWLRRARSA